MNDQKKELTNIDEITAKEWKVITLEFKPIVKRSIEEIVHWECRESDAGKNFILKEFSKIKDKMLEPDSELERSATVLQGKGKDTHSVS